MKKRNSGDLPPEGSSVNDVEQSSQEVTTSTTSAEEERQKKFADLNEGEFRNTVLTWMISVKSKFDEMDSKMGQVLKLEPKIEALIDSYEKLINERRGSQVQVPASAPTMGSNPLAPVRVDGGNGGGGPVDRFLEGLLPRLGDEIGKTLGLSSQQAMTGSTSEMTNLVQRAMLEGFMEDVRLTKAFRLASMKKWFGKETLNTEDMQAAIEGETKPIANKSEVSSSEHPE